MFKQSWKYPTGFPESAIVIDISGSMDHKQRQDVFEAACAMTSLVGSKVYGYKECDKVISVIRLDEPQAKSVHYCGDDGNTPSGTALLTTAMELKRGGMIIHLTDGHHNHGPSPIQVQPKIMDRGINCVHLIWEDTRQYSGMTVRKINGLSEFPKALESVLREELKIKF